MATPVAGDNYDVTFQYGTSTVGYMVVPGSYAYERVDDFAPRIATGTAPTLREGIWDAFGQVGAPEGIDQILYTNPNRVYWSDGQMYLSKERGIQLNSKWNSSDAAQSATAPMIVDGTIGGTDYVAFAVGTRVRRVSGSAWTTWVAHSGSGAFAANCVWLYRHGTNFFAACGSGADFYRSADLDTWSQPAAGEKASCFVTYSLNGTTYLVKSIGAAFKTSSDGGATWSSAVTVGDSATVITGLGVAFGLLVIGKEDGLYHWDGVSVIEEVTFPQQRSTLNCRALVYHDGFLYTHILKKIVKLSFSGGGIANMTDITPNMFGDANKELWGHGLPAWMWSGPANGLYVAFDDGESVYPEVLSYNGMGWQQEYRGTSGDNMLAGGYSRLASRSWINDGATRLRRHITISDMPFADYPTSGQFITSDFDGGLPTMYKAFKSIWVDARNASTARKITLEYSIDQGTTWTNIGDVTASGITEFLLTGTAIAVGAQRARFRFTLASSSGTPVVQQYSVSFLTRPDPIYGYRMTLMVGNSQTLRDLTVESEAEDVRRAFLVSLEASLAPVKFTAMNGDEVWCYITKTSVRRPSEDDLSNEWLIDVTLVEAMANNRHDAVYWDSFVWK